MGQHMLGLHMGGKVHLHQFHIALGAEDPLAELLRVGMTLPHHPEAKGLCRVTPKRIVIMKIYDHRLVHILTEAHAVK